MEWTRGSVTDRAWGVTLARFASRRLTGELVVTTTVGVIRVAFRDGAIVGALSPMAADSAVRVGMQLNLITPPQVNELVRRIAAAPDRDEVEVLGEVTRLSPDQLRKLRRRLVALRAARTFAIDQGTYVIEDRIRMPIEPGNELDTRAVIYLGARMHASSERLSDDLRLLGWRVSFTRELIEDLPQFGFGPNEEPIIAALQNGRTLADVVSTLPEADLRTAQAVVYALITWSAPHLPSPPRSGMSGPIPLIDLDAPDAPEVQQELADNLSVSFRGKSPSSPPRQPGATGAPPPSPTPSPTGSATYPVQRPSTPSSSPRMISATTNPGVSQPRTTSTTSSPGIPRTTSSPGMPRTTSSTTSPGLPRTTSSTTNPGLPVRPTPNPTGAPNRPASPTGSGAGVPVRPSSSTLSGATGSQPRMINATTAVGSGPQAAHRPAKTTAEQVRSDAEEARRRGEMAMRREQLPQAIEEFKKAAELEPKNGAVFALLAWTQFCAAPEKPAVANETRKALATASMNTEEPIAKLYLGRVERMLGRDREALRHFQDVLMTHPRNTEALSEVRVLESRLANSSSSGGFKKK